MLQAVRTPQLQNICQEILLPLSWELPFCQLLAPHLCFIYPVPAPSVGINRGAVPALFECESLNTEEFKLIKINYQGVKYLGVKPGSYSEIYGWNHQNDQAGSSWESCLPRTGFLAGGTSSFLNEGVKLSVTTNQI